MFLKKKSIKGELNFAGGYKEATHLYCHTTGVMDGGGTFATAGRTYKIKQLKEKLGRTGTEQFLIESDFSDNHHFNCFEDDTVDKNGYGTWFSLIREEDVDKKEME